MDERPMSVRWFTRLLNVRRVGEEMSSLIVLKKSGSALQAIRQVHIEDPS
jgi:hypothetical protein